MRGGLFGDQFTIIYEATDSELNPVHKYIPRLGSWKCLTLNFSKNMLRNRDCYTLKLTFDFNAMLILDVKSNHGYKYLHIPLIINGLFNRIFGNEYDVTVRDDGYISVENAPDSIKFNQYKLTDLASPNSVDSSKSDELKSGKKFTKDCVIELEFCPSGDTTTVQLKNFTTYVEKVVSVKYWDWSTAYPENEFITVNKNFDEVVANIDKLVKDKNKNLYLLLPSVLDSIHQTKPTYMYIDNMHNIDKQFYWFDKTKLDEHKKNALTKYKDIKAKKEAEENEAVNARKEEHKRQMAELEQSSKVTIDPNYNDS